MKRWTTKKHWLVFILCAVSLHLLLLLTVRRSFFSIFLRPLPRNASPDGGAPFSPDAIITVPVLLDEETRERPAERPVISEDETRREQFDDSLPSGSSGPRHSVEDGITGDDDTPLRSMGSVPALVIPPKPVEIAWPDTRGLRECLGESIELRILVANDGRILQIAPVAEDGPPECVAAALEAAGRIVFLPGLIDGRRAEMWTEIRIDFRDRQ